MLPGLKMVYEFREAVQNAWERGRYKHDASYYRKLTKIANSDYAFGERQQGVDPSILEDYDRGFLDFDKKKGRARSSKPDDELSAFNFSFEIRF